MVFVIEIDIVFVIEISYFCSDVLISTSEHNNGLTEKEIIR